MDDEKVTVRVNICGTEYPIQAEEEAEYIQRIAAYVDERMREVPVSVTMQSLTSVAVLTAIRIADELHKEREKRQEQVVSESMHDHRIADLIRRMDDLLESSIPEQDDEHESHDRSC
jgi:cell division protein ZapA